MIKVAICDDDKEFRKNMHSIVEKHFLTKERSVWIVEFKNGNRLLASHVRFDIIFLDIEMDKPNGFEIGSILAGYSPRPVIVFTTNALQYAVRGYGIAFRFLCKPITITMFQSVVREALDEILPQKAAVTCGSTQKMISINDVIYFESLNRHIIFHFANTMFYYIYNTFFVSKNYIVPKNFYNSWALLMILCSRTCRNS